MCAAAGARLCSNDELANQVAKGASKSCRVHGRPVWTSTQCTHSSGKVGTAVRRGDGKTNKDKCIPDKNTKLKRSVVCCASVDPAVAFLTHHGSASSNTGAMSIFESSSSSSGGGSESGSGANAAAAAGIGALIVVVGLLGVAVSQRRRRGQRQESEHDHEHEHEQCESGDQQETLEDAMATIESASMMEPMTSLDTDNGFVLDDAGTLRLASVQRGNPLYRGSVYTAEDEIGMAGIDEMSAL